MPQVRDFLERSGFRARFEDKGRFSDYLTHSPTFILTEKYPALIGMSAMLSAVWKPELLVVGVR